MESEKSCTKNGKSETITIDPTLVKSIIILDAQVRTTISSITSWMRKYILESYQSDQVRKSFPLTWLSDRNGEFTNYYLVPPPPNKFHSIGFVKLVPVDSKFFIHIEISTSSRIPWDFSIEKAIEVYDNGKNFLAKMAIDILKYFPVVDGKIKIRPIIVGDEIIIENLYKKRPPGRPRNAMYEECKIQLLYGIPPSQVKRNFDEKVNPDILNPHTMWRRILKDVEKIKNEQN